MRAAGARGGAGTPAGRVWEGYTQNEKFENEKAPGCRVMVHNRLRETRVLNEHVYH